jgi:hypothetical protein
VGIVTVTEEIVPSQEAAFDGRLARLLRLDQRRILLLIGLGIVTMTLLIVFSGGQEVLTALAGVDWRLIAVALVIHYSGFAVRGLRWQQLLALIGHPLRWTTVTALLLSGWFVSALLPLRAGEIVRVGVLRLPARGRSAVPVADSLGSLVLERTLDLLAIVLLGLGFGYVAVRAQLPTWVLAAYGVGLLGLVVAGGTLLIAPALLERLRRWLNYPLWHKALDFAAQVVTSLRALARQPWLALLVLVESLYIWLCDALLMWLVLASLGAVVPLVSAAFVALTVDVFATVPLTPGGVGQIETVNAALLTLLQITGVNVGATVLVNRVISYWSFLLFTGIVTVVTGVGQLGNRQPS